MASSYRASPENAGQRLDQFLVAQIGDVSRARVQQLIEQEKVKIKGRPVRASYRILGDEEVEISGALQVPPLKATAENIPLDVVYEDDSLAVVNKPAGMMVHAGAGAVADDEGSDPRSHGTLVNALLYRFRRLSKEGGELRPGIVHRLDKDTSGLIVVAKTDAAHRKLAEQFASRQVQKRYIALVHGLPKKESGRITEPVGRDPVRRNRMSVRSRDGRDAVSSYKVKKTYNTAFGKFALLDVTIETGRTHQIRVHLASIGHPVVGDHLYGAPREIEPVSTVYRRALPKNTKATRDREVTELARRLTEARHNAPTPISRKRQSPVAPERLKPEKLTLDRNFLHAAEIAFTHPKSAKPLRFNAELPKELSAFMEQLVHLTA